jgi:hypothetical protein
MKTIFKTNESKRLLILSLLSMILITSCMSMTALADPNTVIIPYLDTEYKYMIVPGGAETGFEVPFYNDNLFSIGNAGFGTYYSGPLYTPEYVKTIWPLNTDLLIRKEFELPADASNLIISIAIDNDAQVFVNGIIISGGWVKHSGLAERDSFVFQVPASILVPGTNLIAVRGHDYGGASYFDLQLTADITESEEQSEYENIPEFPTIAIPMIAIMGLMFLFKRN